MENVLLMFLWNFMYAYKFKGVILTVRTFVYAYRELMKVVAEMGLAQILEANEILKNT